jgi:hypothetical protein
LGVAKGEVLPGEAMLMPMATGMVAAELAAGVAASTPSFLRRAAAEFPVRAAAVDTPVNKRLALTA